MIFNKKDNVEYIHIDRQDMRAHLERAKRDLQRAREMLQKKGDAVRRPGAMLYLSQAEKRLVNIEYSLKE